MTTALLTSKAFLSLSKPEFGDVITNLKLQKLLYYVQGFHLAIHKQKLFEEDLYAWQYGPVVPAIYHQFKDRGADVIPFEESFDIKSNFNEDQEELIKEVYELYGQFSALKLMNMTHDEMPWKTTEIGEIISESKLVDYFKTLLVSDVKKDD